MMTHYSNADQKEDLRYACVEALASLTPHFPEILLNNVNLYIKLSHSLITLITDEYAEIRLEASKLIKSEDSGLTHNDNMALKVALKQLFSNLQNHQNLTTENKAQIKDFIFQCISSEKYEKYKAMAYYNSRIFNFDKPNKYREDLKVIKAMMAGLKHSGYNPEISADDWNKYLEVNKVYKPRDFENEVKTYFEDIFARNEFIFGKAVQNLVVDKLVKNGDDDVESGIQVLGREYFEQFLA